MIVRLHHFMNTGLFRNPRLLLLFSICIIAVVGLVVYGRIPQSDAYNHFADQRTFFGIPNFFDTTSNLPFLLVGLFGIYRFRKGVPPGSLAILRPAYLTFLVGSTLVAFGSAYYHLNPGNATLFWDRLPMTIAFMAFLSIVVGEYINPNISRRILLPLLSFGVFSVVYWRTTGTNDGGDLRPYILVQYLPMLLIPIIALLYQARLQPGIYLWSLLAMYGFAKILELLDFSIFQALHVVSGHTLKHVGAAIGVLLFELGLLKRHHVPAAPL